MNLYTNIGSFSGFGGWNTVSSNTFGTFSPSEWRPVSVPQVSDYVPIPDHVPLYPLSVTEHSGLERVITNTVSVKPDSAKDSSSEVSSLAGLPFSENSAGWDGFSEDSAIVSNIRPQSLNPSITADTAVSPAAARPDQEGSTGNTEDAAHSSDGANSIENTPTDPLNQSIGAIGDAAAYADAALTNPHQAFLAEAEKFKNSASLKHDLASGFSQTIIEFEEGRIYDERRAYYANNREALNEAVEKIRTDAAELTQKHGEAAGKAYFLGGVIKTIGSAAPSTPMSWAVASIPHGKTATGIPWPGRWPKLPLRLRLLTVVRRLPEQPGFSLWDLVLLLGVPELLLLF